MSAYSDYKVGAISKDEYISIMRRENADTLSEPSGNKKQFASAEIEFDGPPDVKKAFLEYALKEFNHTIEDGISVPKPDYKLSDETWEIKNDNEHILWDLDAGYLLIEEKSNFWVEDSPYGSFEVCDFLFDSDEEVDNFVETFINDNPTLQLSSFTVSVSETKQYVKEVSHEIDLD